MNFRVAPFCMQCILAYGPFYIERIMDCSQCQKIADIQARIKELEERLDLVSRIVEGEIMVGHLERQGFVFPGKDIRFSEVVPKSN